MVEYVIELVQNGVIYSLVHIECDGRITEMKPTPDGYAHCKKFRVKARAEKLASKFAEAQLAHTYGGHVYGSKTKVAPKQSQVNKRPAYRSIY